MIPIDCNFTIFSLYLYVLIDYRSGATQQIYPHFFFNVTQIDKKIMLKFSTGRLIDQQTNWLADWLADWIMTSGKCSSKIAGRNMHVLVTLILLCTHNITLFTASLINFGSPYPHCHLATILCKNSVAHSKWHIKFLSHAKNGRKC